MSLYIASLNSGSNGNCYYIGNHREAILVDAGLSCRETEKRMRRLGLSMELVRAIFISHEHDDHIRGLEVLSKRYQIPVYITDDTLSHSKLELEGHLVRSFDISEPVVIGGLSITSFTKTHDAIDPHSFVIGAQGDDGRDIRIGVFTDIGYVCENLTRHFTLCHAAFLEANYDEKMLEEGRYPWPLKNRIRGGQGHLSNYQALELFVRHRPSFMSHVLLAHLSQDNNRPELALSLFEESATGALVVVASRHAESAIYVIDGKYEGKGGIGAEAEWGVADATALGSNAAAAAKAGGQAGEIVEATVGKVASGVGHSMIRRRKKALGSRSGTANVTQTSLF